MRFYVCDFIYVLQEIREKDEQLILLQEKLDRIVTTSQVCFVDTLFLNIFFEKYTHQISCIGSTGTY